ncbi:MAG: T9SS type A sorting domain-containing protein, partial [Bacteroidales bacterium]|nr:T9SS type A sorting domain-containing protein [Bacteroidales bacterium]
LGKQIFHPLGYKYNGIADAQQISYLSNPNQQYYPAGNEFSQYRQAGTFDFDNSQGDYLVYFHENNTSLRYKPEYSVNIGLDNSLQWLSSRCPSKLGGGGNISTESTLLTQAQLALNSSIIIRNIWKDGGNTNLENEVETTLPWDVYVEFNGLIAESPYLSDEVLMATINNSAFTSLMIKLIMVANPQASHNDEIMEAIYNRIPALPQSYIDAIRAGESSVSQLELLEANVSANYHLVRSIESNIIDIYRSDTINANAYTNMLSYMIARPGLQDKYMLAATYLAHNDFTNMQTVLNDISTTFSLDNKETLEYQNNLATFAIARDIKENDKHMGDLSATQTSNLETIINQSGTNHSMALALLVWNNPDMELNELILKKPENGSRMAAPEQAKRPEITSLFKVFPNPAKDYFTLQYNSDIEQIKGLNAIITDMQGKTIRKIKFNNNNIDELIDTHELKPGVYSISLYASDLLIEAQRITIVK